MRIVFFCFKEYHSDKAGKTLQQGRDVIDSRQYSASKKHQCGKVGKTLHEEGEVAGSGQYFAAKNKHFGKGREDTASGPRGYRLRTAFCC